MITKKKCKHCEKEFYGTARKKYCSDKCRLYAWRKSLKDKRNEQKQPW